VQQQAQPQVQSRQQYGYLPLQSQAAGDPAGLSMRRGTLSPLIGAAAATATHEQSKREDGDAGDDQEQEPPPYEEETEMLTPELVTGRYENRSRWVAPRDSFLNDFADMSLVEDASHTIVGGDLITRDGDDDDDYEVELVTNAENEVNATGEMVEVSELLEFPLSPPKPEDAGAAVVP
jgi:hypothetical protein